MRRRTPASVAVGIDSPSGITHRVHDHRVGHRPASHMLLRARPGPASPYGDPAALLSQDPADRLDRDRPAGIRR